MSTATDTPPEPFGDAVTSRATALRVAHPEIRGVDVDLLFLAFLQHASRFGVFSYGPITIDVALVEDLYFQTLSNSPKSGERRQVADSARGFYQRVASELEAAGTRRPNELHYLVAFMRSPDGLPHRVFGELGVAPEAVLSHARREASGHGRRPDAFLTPEDVAKRFSVNVQTVRGWIRSGSLPASRLAGKRVLRVRESDLDALLEPVDPAEFE